MYVCMHIYIKAYNYIKISLSLPCMYVCMYVCMYSILRTAITMILSDVVVRAAGQYIQTHQIFEVGDRSLAPELRPIRVRKLVLGVQRPGPNNNCCGMDCSAYCGSIVRRWRRCMYCMYVCMYGMYWEDAKLFLL